MVEIRETGESGPFGPRGARPKPSWQSKAVLLVVAPFVAVDVLLESRWWLLQRLPEIALCSLGISILFGLVVLRLRAGTPMAALLGCGISASLMYSTTTLPYRPWFTALPAVLSVFLLAFVGTRLGRGRKEKLGTAESRRGRNAAQVAANLGVAALAAEPIAQWVLLHSNWFPHGLEAVLGSVLGAAGGHPVFAPMIAALAEAAADTVSSEVGQVLGGVPRTITTGKRAKPGEDGAISLVGTAAGAVAAAIVAVIGAWALHGDQAFAAVTCAGGIFGLLFDSLLGATLERKGWLNNDAVNFLSTWSAAVFALVVPAILAHR